MKKNRKVTLTFHKDDEWILEELRNLVETKQAMGYVSSISFEVARLLRNNLLGDFDYFMERDNKIKKRIAPMKAPIDVRPLFEEYLQMYHRCAVVDSKVEGEAWRTMVEDKLMICRVYEEYFEIWMSDRKFLNDVETQFASCLEEPEDGK